MQDYNPQFTDEKIKVQRYDLFTVTEHKLGGL